MLLYESLILLYTPVAFLFVLLLIWTIDCQKLKMKAPEWIPAFVLSRRNLAGLWLKP